MATSESILLKELSGKLGRELVFKQWGGKTILSKYPDMSNRKLSKKQKKVNEIMADANYEAKRVIADEKLRDAALVRLNVTRNKLYTSLIKEFWQIAKQSM